MKIFFSLKEYMDNKKPSFVECRVCGSVSVVRFNSYKHYCYACYDCNSVFHTKKTGRYLLEYLFFPRWLRGLIPRAAYLRLFHAPNEKVDRTSFYDVYEKEALTPDPIRISQARQLIDQLEINGITLLDKKILDISGGPGLVARELEARGAKVTLTEFSEVAVRGMARSLGLDCLKFDYATDCLGAAVQGRLFDIIMIRSSLIFCDDIDRLLASLNRLLKPDGYVLIETIVPSLDEVFWWQQMEFKFPIIYSQEAIEKYFYKHGFLLRYGYREYGAYEGIKWRGTKDVGRALFTWLVDYPMMLAYYWLAPKRKIPIDQSTRHKFLTQLWQKVVTRDLVPVIYHTYPANHENQSPHFSYCYNGYLKKQPRADT